MNNVFPEKLDDWAIFLDVDGTLLDIAETPEMVVVPPDLPNELALLSKRLNGALAVVSGRSIQSIDGLFHPFKFPAAGLHGNEIRPVSRGPVGRATVDAMCLNPAREALERFAEAHAGIICEDKGASLAIHYRLAPEFFPLIDEMVKVLVENLGHLWTRQEGKMVVEIRPSGSNKGSSLAEILKSHQFKGRFPLAVGDDLTDETMFVAANDLNGRSVKVGSTDATTVAQYQVSSPDVVRSWISKMVTDRAEPRYPVEL
jgi:trehalose 6-phosphate phosphatase